MKQQRIQLIKNILSTQNIGDQTELQRALRKAGEYATQATLSRDMKALNVSKVKLPDGSARYMLPDDAALASQVAPRRYDTEESILRVSYNGVFAVIKTQPGYAQAVGCDIDKKAGGMILGTIAGFDTILVIPVEGETQAELRNLLDKILLSYGSHQG